MDTVAGELHAKTCEERMNLLRHMLETLAIALFSMCLPFLFVAAIVWGRDATGVDADSIWFVKAAGTFLMPFGMVLWYIAVAHLVLRRRASLLHTACGVRRHGPTDVPVVEDGGCITCEDQQTGIRSIVWNTHPRVVARCMGAGREVHLRRWASGDRRTGKADGGT